MVTQQDGDENLDETLANYSPDAPGEPNPALQQQPVDPVPGVHKETRGHREGSGSSEGSGHTSGGGRDSH